MVGVGGLEPSTFWSQTKRATNCAIPRTCYNVTLKRKKSTRKTKKGGKTFPFYCAGRIRRNAGKPCT